MFFFFSFDYWSAPKLFFFIWLDIHKYIAKSYRKNIGNIYNNGKFILKSKFDNHI